MVTSADPTGTGMPAGDPKDWPAAPRPDVPDTQQQAPQAADNSLLGTFARVMDNITPDDMGGILRGDSGWTANIPGYNQTVGAAADVALTGGGAVVDAINWGSDQMNHLGAALMSWMPGGIQTLDWDQAHQVSFGQVTMANAGIAMRQAKQGDVAESLLSTLGATTFGMLAAAIDQSNPTVTQDNFNILDPEFQKRAFEDSVVGKWGSGLADAVWMVAADPTIVAGKATNVLRFGMKAGEFAGLTNRALRTSKQVADFGDAILKAGDDLAMAKTGATIERTAEHEQLLAILEGNADSLLNNPLVKSSGMERDTARLFGQTSLEDPQTGAALVAASAGYFPAFKILQERAPRLYDDFTNVLGVDTLQAAPTAKLTAEQIKHADSLVDDTLVGGQLITRGGASVAPSFIRAANAYRSGKAAVDLSSEGVSKSDYALRLQQEIPVSKGGQWVQERLEGYASSRPVTMVRWLGKQAPAGIVHLKGGDGQVAQDEIRAFAQKSGLDQRTAEAYVNDFISAQTPEARRIVAERLEDEAVRKAASSLGVSEETARAAYKSYNASRARHLDSIRNSKNGVAVDPHTRGIIATPMFYSELDEAFPLLDMKTFRRVVKGNQTFLRTVNDVEIIADHLNTLWKVSVLLRLGYTQRNLAEGALRSVAVLGAVATNPEAWAALPANTVRYARYKTAARAAKASNKAVTDAANNINLARQELMSARNAAGVPKYFEQQAKATAAASEIRRLERKAASRNGLTREERRALNSARSTHARAKREAERINREQIMPAQGQLLSLSQREQSLMRELEALQGQALEANAKAAERLAKRKIGGRRGNKMYDGTEMMGAFEGVPGKQAAFLSSADKTVAQTFDAAMASRMETLAGSADWKVFDPRTLSAEEMATYWDERATRINQHFRGDPLAERILRDMPVEDIKAWLLSPAGAKYRKDMDIVGRSLRTEGEINEFLSKAFSQIHAEVPPGRLREIALERDVTSGEVAAIEGVRSDLPAVMGRGVDSAATNVFFKGLDATQGVTQRLMKWLGTIPETKMLRHPFYNSVYKEHQARLYRLAAEQGADMSSMALRSRINKLSHAQALKATKETMYTIERLSNAAVMLRYISPFFPAFENSIRVWGRIVYQNPAVLGVGNLLWNIPNNMGWVVDQNGNKVAKSNPLRDEGNYIVWPKPVADLLSKSFGPFTPGEAVRTPQGSLNVVFPGSEPWFPGVGPMVQIPTALVLRGKPETTDILRSMMSEQMFKQIVPSGNPNVDLFEVMAPTAVRKLKQMWSGEDTDSAYLTALNMMLEDAYIQSQIDGTVLTQRDIKKVQEKTNQFWSWQVVAALGLPFQSQLQSKFQPQRDFWKSLLDDQSLSYSQRVDKFHEAFPDFGDALDAITRGGSTSEYGLQPTLSTWQKITNNPDLVAELAATSPELVGMFGNMGKWDDPFSYSVYTEMQSNNFGGASATMRRKKTPEEILKSNQVSDGWREYHKVAAYLEDQAAQYGYTSLQTKDAEWLAAIRDQAITQIGEKYPGWAQERKVYQDKLPMFLAGARTIVANGNLVNEDSTVKTLAKYLEVRDYIAAEKAKSSDTEYRNYLDQIGYSAAWDLRKQDIGFADFYDQYLSGDDFRVG